MLSLILAGFLSSAAGVGGQLAAQAAWDKFAKDHPEEVRALTEGMFEAFVRLTQAALVTMGHDIEVDGVLGRETERAIKQFQAKHGLEQIDGIPGRNTMRALAAELIKKQTP